MQEVDNDQMLDLANDDGEELIKYLREKKKIEPDRSLRVYEYKNGKLRCYELYRVESSSKPPYTLFLVNDNHFEAMVKPEDLPDEERS